MEDRLSPDQLQMYLHHIKLVKEELHPSLDTLTAVHRQHSRLIPFANVTTPSIPSYLKELGFPVKTPDTSTEGVVHKLLQKKWGGYCFESNSLLAKALAALGFEVYCAAASNVLRSSDQELVLCGFSHQVILAKEPQSLAWYVMDVAWGSGTPHQPISMQASPQDRETGAAHRLRRGFVDRPGVPSDEELCTRHAACGWYMQKFSRTEQQWQDLYFFREAEATQGDFDMMNFWIANHPDSEFQKLKLSIRTDDGGHGRTTILGTHLKAFGKEGDLVSEREVQNVHELKEVLESHFGIIP